MVHNYKSFTRNFPTSDSETETVFLGMLSTVLIIENYFKKEIITEIINFRKRNRIDYLLFCVLTISLQTVGNPDILQKNKKKKPRFQSLNKQGTSGRYRFPQPRPVFNLETWILSSPNPLSYRK